MERKCYLKPTAKVVKLQQQCHILAGSLSRGNYEDTEWGNDND